VEGTVVEQQPDGSLLVKDETGTLSIQTTQMTPVANGSRVAVVGFPSLDATPSVFENAIFRETSAAAPAQSLPILTTSAQIHRLPRNAGTRRYPVHLRAVLTYYDP